jgi:twinkle protein
MERQMIDKELIRQAKEKIGDSAADIIADIFQLEKYDTRNKKGCCPFHSERTPSFIFDSKRLRYHCFSCGKSVDVVDAFIEGKHMTFNEAATKVFELADMTVPMPEVGLLDKGADYVYPTLPDGDMTPAYEYLAKRGISKAVVDYVGIKCDNRGVMHFPFYSFGDVLTMVKCRPAHKVIKGEGAKCWVQKGTSSSPLLFNANRINTELPLIITEGCIDALAVMECGYFNVVSVPLGSQNLQWIAQNLDWLDQFQDIILCGDADEAGKKMNIEASSRLGTDRCRFFLHPTYKVNGKLKQINDINECLYRLGKAETRKCIDAAINAPNPKVIDFADIKSVDWSQVDGISFGLTELDKQLFKAYRSSLTLIFAKPSSGKTSYINQVIASAIDDDRRVFLYTDELSEEMFKNWFNFTVAGRRHIQSFTSKEGSPYYKVSPIAEIKISEYYKDRLYIYRDTESSNIDSLIGCIKEEIRRKGTSVIVLDNLMTIDIDSKANELEQQKIIMKKLAKLAKDYNVVVILVAHSKKTKEALGLEDASGTFAIANLSGRMLSMERNINQGDNSYDVMFTIQKDRFGSKNGVKVPVRFDFPSRRFYTSEAELDRRYKWDIIEPTVKELPKSESLERMTMSENADEEVFGA